MGSFFIGIMGSELIKRIEALTNVFAGNPILPPYLTSTTPAE